MPNAAASFDDAFDYDEPARKKAPARSRATPGKAPARKKPGKGKRRGLGFGFDMNKVARYAAIGMSATVALAIMVNALVMQKGHHPAPLFGTAIALGPSPAPAPVPRPAPAPVEEAKPAPEPAPVAKGRHVATAPDSAAAGDPIARLLQGDAAGAASSGKSETKTVLGAQRALLKLGFALKPNGTLGPQTKKAIELFEKDRHLPVKGELTHRLVKILAAESGIRID